MNRLFVILSLLLFDIMPFGAEVQASEKKKITLPSYNPVRDRVPATPEAQDLHKKIMKVSRDLKTLKAVPLNDPAIDKRFSAMIQRKIMSINAKLDVLKADMKRRKDAYKRGAALPKTKRTQKKKSSRLQSDQLALKPTIIAGDDTAAEIKNLKNSLHVIMKKINILEQKNKARQMVQASKLGALEPHKEKALKAKRSRRVQMPAAFPLPVAKRYVALAPKLVRTKIIYPSQVPPSINNKQDKPQVGVSRGQPFGVLLPSQKPFLTEQKSRRAKRSKKTHKKYASVEDQEGQEEAWSQDTILKAKKQCVKLFKKLNITYVEKTPIKNGRCGTPAPIHFRGFGKKHEVSIVPPATINCKATAVIANWMNKKVQPLAIKLLGFPIAKIHNVASYNCRNRYGRKNGRISEHAFANALDVMAFTTKNGEKIDLLKHFYAEDEKGEFLRSVHKLACKDKFGTVLGPEANAAHKNHFHFDLAKRRRSAYCE